MSENLSLLFHREWSREYDLYVVGYIRRRQQVEQDFRSFGRATALFRKYKKKYRSAYFRVRIAPAVMMRRALNAPNALFKLIRKSSDFVGEPITVPVKFGVK